MTVIPRLALVVAFFSASQDIAIDAYRREILPDEEMGLGNVVHVNAYKIAGSGAGLSVPDIGRSPAMECRLLVDRPVHAARTVHDAAGQGAGILQTRPAPTLRSAVVEPFREFIGEKAGRVPWPCWPSFFSTNWATAWPRPWPRPFYLDMGFSKTEIGMVAKNAGLWPNVIGGILGGIMDGLSLAFPAPFGFSAYCRPLVILGFAWLVQCRHSLSSLAAVIGAEAFGVGLGTAAFVAFTASTDPPRLYRDPVRLIHQPGRHPQDPGQRLHRLYSGRGRP